MGAWDNPGAGMFPLILSILLIVSGVGWLIAGKRGEGEGEIKWAEIPKDQAVPFKIIALTIGFVFGFEYLGFLVTASLYLFLLFIWVSRYNLWISLGLSILIGGGSWLIFGELLQVYLPVGVLFD